MEPTRYLAQLQALVAVEVEFLVTALLVVLVVEVPE
jgi:hypothetical protein